MPFVKHALSPIRRIIGLMSMGLLGIVLIFAGLTALFASPISPADIPVVSIIGSLEDEPEINDYGRQTHIRLRLKEYPNRRFDIEGASYDATKVGLVEDHVKAGDSVALQVSAEDYKNNIEQQMTPDRISTITVYEFRSKGRAFLTLADYCKEVNANSWLGFICLALGILSLVVAMRPIIQMKNAQKKFRRY